MVIHANKDITDALNLIDITNEICKVSEHHLTIFGKYESIDLRRSEILIKSKFKQVSFEINIKSF